MDDEAAVLTLGQQWFGAAELGDVRRTRRLVKLADDILRHPGGTLPDKINSPANLKAMYRLMNREQVTHAAVIAGPCAVTRKKMAAAEGPVLIVHDATELDYSGLHSIPTLGQLGKGNHRGYIAHNVLAVKAETREVIGLAYQHLVKRAQPKKDETREQRRDRGDRESRWWKDASEHVPPAPQGKRYVEIGDRGSDVLEFIDYLEATGKQYTLRSKHNRKIQLENGDKTKLHDFARQLPEGGRRTVSVPASEGRTARTAVVAVSWACVKLLIPQQPRGEVRGEPLTAWVVCLREIAPPAGVEPLEWILLTNVPVNSFVDACERIDWYHTRWIIEEYHKGMKTGCQIEDMQFTTEAGLRPAIALLSVVAVSLLQLRDISRRPDAQTLPATEIFSPRLVESLSVWRYQQRRTNLTVHEFCFALARLGGHQNRKCDRQPGWLVLWRGWTKLQMMEQYASALAEARCG